MRQSGKDIMDQLIESQGQQIEKDLEFMCTKHNLDLNDPEVDLDVQCGIDRTTTGAICIRYCLKKKGVALETWGYEMDLTLLV